MKLMTEAVKEKLFFGTLGHDYNIYRMQNYTKCAKIYKLSCVFVGYTNKNS